MPNTRKQAQQEPDGVVDSSVGSINEPEAELGPLRPDYNCYGSNVVRASLSASVVVTFSLVGGCSTGRQPQEQTPQAPGETEWKPRANGWGQVEPQPTPDRQERQRGDTEIESEVDAGLPEPRVAEKGEFVRHELRPDASCWEYLERPCPDGARCQIPSPRQVRCAEEILPRPVAGEVPRSRADGSCWVHPDIECPEDPRMSCNPPPPQRVRCPESPSP